MTVIGLISAKASPGVTSIAVGLSWVWGTRNTDALLVETDPAGGSLMLRFGLEERPSTLTLMSDARRGNKTEVLLNNYQRIGGHPVIAAPTSPEETVRAIPALADILTHHTDDNSSRLVVDLGRYRGRVQTPLIAATSGTIIVVRPRPDEVQSAAHLITEIAPANPSLGLVVVGDAPYSPHDVAATLRPPLIGVLPDDAAVASAFNGGTFSSKALRRSVLWRSLESVATSIDGSLTTMPPPPPAPVMTETKIIVGATQ